jgi:hypothetical protein
MAFNTSSRVSGKASALLLLALVLTPTFASAAGPDWCGELTSKQVQKNVALASEAARLAPYAIMSNNTYSGEGALPLPAGWQEVPELGRQMPAVGLALSVFEKRDDRRLIEVVVAFRGTDERKDWIQNLVPFFRNQVPPAAREFERIRDHYGNRPVRMVATGHSLGGGLAFHMSFVYPNVEAIAFNSSPVTKAGMKLVSGNRRTSAWESGEILQAPRNPINVFRSRWRDTKRVEFRFLHGSPIKQHSMRALAVNLARLGAIQSKELQTWLAKNCVPGDTQ